MLQRAQIEVFGEQDLPTKCAISHQGFYEAKLITSADSISNVYTVSMMDCTRHVALSLLQMQSFQ